MDVRRERFKKGCQINILPLIGIANEIGAEVGDELREIGP